MSTGNDDATVAKDSNESPRSDRDTIELQSTDVESSPAVDDAIDSDDVNVLPGTGGPDDGGDIEVDPEDLRL